MQLHYTSNEVVPQTYNKDNVRCITFIDGHLCVIYEDSDGKPHTLSYTKESLNGSIISIF